MGSTFVMGCIQAMEGERDPRCLMQAFALVPMLCNRFILGELEESLFDVCACYFPVDFNPVSLVHGKFLLHWLPEGNPRDSGIFCK